MMGICEITRVSAAVVERVVETGIASILSNRAGRRRSAARAPMKGSWLPRGGQTGDAHGVAARGRVGALMVCVGEGNAATWRVRAHGLTWLGRCAMGDGCSMHCASPIAPIL